MYNQAVAAGTGNSGTCLVVEDSSFDQEKFRRILARSFGNMQVVMAATLAEARDRVSKMSTDLILLDNSLPDGIGANFAVELSEDPDHANIPVIMVSDFPTPFMYQKAEIAGVKHVVDKSNFGARFIHDALVANEKKKPRKRYTN
ncbi:response regulator [uncultured Roseobacter sp.]|uniref:response regulator n=1 Tax=uncultured Roseobacter sp. TaxID=114847 RepID=UPI0026294E47|nr:response regulator [uncultured Roseobacter sp.]